MNRERLLRHLLNVSGVAIQAYLEARTVAILVRDGESLDGSSGVFVRIGTRVFVATCAHAIRGSSETAITLLTSRAAGREKPDVIGLGWRGGTKSDPLDIGWLEIDPRHESRVEQTVLDVSDLAAELPPPGQFVALHGYPIAKIQKTPLLARPYLSVTRVVTRDSYPFETSDKDLVYEYPAEGYTIGGGEDLGPTPHPKGMSGGPVWNARLDLERESFWDPSRLRVCAIHHTFYGAGALTRGTGIRAWLEMMRDDHPGLGSDLTQYLR